MHVLYRALGRRAGTWSVGGFQALGPPAGPAARACQPASSDRLVCSGSSVVLLHACQMFAQSEPNRQRRQRVREGHV